VSSRCDFSHKTVAFPSAKSGHRGGVQYAGMIIRVKRNVVRQPQEVSGWPAAVAEARATVRNLLAVRASSGVGRWAAPPGCSVTGFLRVVLL